VSQLLSRRRLANAKLCLWTRQVNESRLGTHLLFQVLDHTLSTVSRTMQFSRMIVSLCPLYRREAVLLHRGLQALGAAAAERIATCNSSAGYFWGGSKGLCCCLRCRAQLHSVPGSGTAYG
jgi:hypothetical protein